MNSLKDKVVWITGASSGIGEALVYAFANEGAKIIISARRQEELERVKKTTALPNDCILILLFDLENTQELDIHALAIIKQFGRIDILINNGGISQRSFAKDTPLFIDRKIMEINFFGTVAVTKSVLPYMLQQNKGLIVVISSISGKFGFFLRSSYSASKHALHGFFESLRMEVFKNNIAVLLICPGKINTNISINAITEKGLNHNKKDKSHSQGLDTAACAKQIIEAIKKGKQEVFIGGKELRAVWIKRFFPNIFLKLIRKQKPE